MASADSGPLEHLNEAERRCLRSYIATLADRLGDNLIEVWLFGSVARGDVWSERFSVHSDIDLLVLTRQPPSPALVEELSNDTYPLFLECGRQMATQWRTVDQWASPAGHRARSFVARVSEEGRKLYPAGQPAIWPA